MEYQLVDLPSMHSNLEWSLQAGAVVAVLGRSGAQPPFAFHLTVENAPAFGSEEIELRLDPAKISAEYTSRIQRTYEPPRLVEFAAIAVAGIALYHAGQHSIVNVAIRGSAADYLVDAEERRMEVAGRSRRSDFGAAWRERVDRLSARVKSGGFYVFVAEFETPAGRLEYFP